MGLNRYRNKPCQCGSGIKFKFCCLPTHQKAQTGLVTNLAKKVQEKTAKYWRKRYKEIAKPENNYTIGCDLAVGKSKTVRRVVELSDKPVNKLLVESE